MFDKIVETFAAAVAAAVAKEVAKQLPTIAEKVAGTVVDRILERIPDFGDLEKLVRDSLSSVPDIGEHIIDDLIGRLRKLPFPFNLL